MKKGFIEWNGEKFPVREIVLPKELGGYEVDVADYELWAAIADDYEKEDEEAVAIDVDIYYYFNSGFIASDPTDEEIINELKENCL